MTPIAAVALAQSPELSAAMDRIATAETVIAVGVTVLIVLGIVVSVMFAWTLRVTTKLLNAVRHDLAPRTEPLLEQTTRLAERANELVDGLREEADTVRETVDEINRRIRQATDVAEQRVRKLAAVLEVVQEEAEKLLIEAAATARGAHAAARALREDGGDGEEAPAKEEERQAG